MLMTGLPFALPRPLGALLLLPALFGVAGGAQAQSMTGQVTTLVVEPLSVVKTADLNFGANIASTAAGTVVVSPAGVRTHNGGVVGVGNAYHAAEFVGSASPGDRVQIRIPNGSITLTRIGGGATMTARAFTMALDNATSLGRGNSGQATVGAAGIFTIRVGATLDVRANQAAGHYEGTFQVNVNYF